MGMPRNLTTDRNYRGGNALHLMATAIQRGYDDPRWMTYKQAADHGWQGRRGEKGTQIEFWEVKLAEKASPGDDAGNGNQHNRRDTRLIRESSDRDCAGDRHHGSGPARPAGGSVLSRRLR